MSFEGKNGRFKIAVTGDFSSSDGTLQLEPQALDALQRIPDVSVDILETAVGVPVTPDILRRFDAIIMKRSPVPPEHLEIPDLRCVHISRNGVGVDHFDLPACTHAGVMITNTPESVRRPMASSAMALILALAHRLPEKRMALRERGWRDRHCHRGIGLTGRVLGVIGCGNIGRDLLRLAAPWEMEHLVSAPSQSPERVAALGGRLVDLDTLLREADFVVLCCPLTAATHHLLDADAFARMKPGSYLVNIARGPVVDEAALIETLTSGHLAGAGIDVFDPEPPAPDNPLLYMENVIATAHNIGFSDEGARVGNTAAVAAVEAVAKGQIPDNVVNPEVVNHPRVQRFLVDRNGEHPR